MYRQLFRSERYRTSPALLKAGFFNPVSASQLWLMGFLGMGAICYVLFFSQGAGSEVSGSAADKAIQSIIPFSYAPYFIPLGQLYGNAQAKPKRLVPYLVIFTGVLLLLSIGRNSRGGFMLGFTSVAFTYGLGLLLGLFQPRIFTLRNALLVGACLLVVTGPLADLGTAMVIVRGQRGGVSTAELMEQTVAVFGDKEAIKARRIADKQE
jgi:hypothetical protein